MGTLEWENGVSGSWSPTSTDESGKPDGAVELTDFMVQVQAFQKAYADKIKVLICEPTIGMIDYKTHESCWDLAFRLKDYETRSKYKFFKTCVGRLLVSYAREKFCEFALQYGFDLILFMDDDHIYPPNIFEELQVHLDKYNIVAPLCFQRDEPYWPVMWHGKLVHDEKKGGYCVDREFIRDFKKGDLIEPDTIGFGCCIIKVDLLRKMKRPWFFTSSSVGEDIVFCLKAREVGAKIVVDTNIEAPHLGEKPLIDYRTFDAYRRDHP
jgi:hypothetical protein